MRLEKMLAVMVTILSVGLVVCGNNRQVETDLKTYKILDLDFENTKVHKVCLLAEFNATIKITHHRQEYFIPISQDATTDGSFCDTNFRSELKLKFHGTVVAMTFHRNTQKTIKMTYCEKCDFGTWNMTFLTISTVIDQRYVVEAALIPANLHLYAYDLYKGINIKRAYKCRRKDHTNTTIGLEKMAIFDTQNSTNESPNAWKAEIQFELIQVQPFLVFKNYFDDPYLCSDITGSLLLVILLPIVYFTIFILFYRIKGKYGCPPWGNRAGKHHISSSKSSISLREDSTNIGSRFSSTLQLTADDNLDCIVEAEFESATNS